MVRGGANDAAFAAPISNPPVQDDLHRHGEIQNRGFRNRWDRVPGIHAIAPTTLKIDENQWG